MHTHTCQICSAVFKTPYKFKKTCCPRCAYIKTKLQTKAGRKLERSEAINHFGAMYDDPLQLFRRSKYYPILKKPWNFASDTGPKSS